MRILLAILFSLMWSLHSSAGEIVVEIGASTSLPSPGTGAIRVKNSKLITVSDLGKTIKVTARKAGHAIITTTQSTTDVFILNSKDYSFYQEAKLEVEQMRGLELSVDETGVIVSGRLLRVSDWQTLSELPNAKYKMVAEIDLAIRDTVRKFVEQKLVQSNLSFPILRFEPHVMALVAKEQTSQKDLYTRSLASLGVEVESSSTVVELQPLVRVRIAVTEIRKKFMQKFGVSWPVTAKAQLLPGWIAPGKAEGVSVQLDALEESGFGKILASPTILCRSGKQAEFFAGGEFPIKVVGHKIREVTWKKHGIILKVAPVADHSGRMSIALTTEVSTIDQSQTVDGVPGLLTNRIESHFDLSQSRTIALSGLLKEESGNSRQGLPGLSSIPILGLLFSSQDYRDHKTELIVFVTPEVVNEGMESESI